MPFGEPEANFAPRGSFGRSIEPAGSYRNESSRHRFCRPKERKASHPQAGLT